MALIAGMLLHQLAVMIQILGSGMVVVRLTRMHAVSVIHDDHSSSYGLIRCCISSSVTVRCPMNAARQQCQQRVHNVQQDSLCSTVCFVAARDATH